MKKTVIAIMAALTAAATIASTTPAQPEQKPDTLQTVRQMCQEYEAKNGLKPIDSADLTRQILTHRKTRKRLLDERVISRARNSKGGEVINAGANPYNYIAYPKALHAKKGDIVISYVTYGRSNKIDDVIGRYDLTLDELRRGEIS